MYMCLSFRALRESRYNFTEKVQTLSVLVFITNFENFDYNFKCIVLNVLPAYVCIVL